MSSVEGMFDRLVEILLPRGGYVMAIFEAYFDESGDLDSEGSILCISGYVLESESAKQMAAEWKAVLDQYELPYFHMVDCVPAPGAGVFRGMPIENRIELVKKLIDLIKKFCLHGVSLFINRNNFSTDEAGKDPYVGCAELAADFVEAIAQTRDPDAKLAYFFESGHASEGTAYGYLVKQAAKTGAAVSFAAKGDVHLLEAADLLAWQSAKWLKDIMGKKRAPRKDFLSLMEHPHSFALLTINKRELLIQHQEWPASRQPDLGYIRTKDTRVSFDAKMWDVLSGDEEPFLISYRWLPVWKVSVAV